MRTRVPPTKRSTISEYSEHGMTICKFFQKGHCRFGAACKFEHVRDDKGTPSGRMSVSGNGTGVGSGNMSGGSSANDGDSRLWPLTTHARENPASGNFLDEEMSPEELRAHAYVSAHRGHSRDVVDRENSIVSDFRRKLATVLPLYSQNAVVKEPSGMAVDDSHDHYQSNGGTSRNGTIPVNDPFAPVAPPQIPQPFFQ